jgi:hypothetical protein
VANELATSTELIDLANSPQVTRIRDFPSTASSLDAGALLVMYKTLRDTAPHRHARDKKYFVGHTGVIPGGGKGLDTVRSIWHIGMDDKR